uniref:Transient receptor potential channel n=1 Tax=Chlamydomonas reinhardtii TaxID=3055 RepID=F2Z8J6_CHLRE|nr:transient receptor potential channel [Chlamydomonas reinhardtii]
MDGGGGDGGGHVDEAETYEVPELLQAKPKDVLQFIEEEGVVKLGEFEVADGLALKAFGGEPFLVMGQEHAEPPGLKELWMERLVEVVGAGRMQGTGWKSTLSVEAHVVNLYDAAAPGRGGLLRPLLGRLRAHGCPPTVFALPAVQAVIALKWSSWARRFLLAEFFFYAAWLAAFSAFSLLLEDGDDTADSGGDDGGGSSIGGGGMGAAAAAVAGGPQWRLYGESPGGGGGGPGAVGGWGLPVVRLLAAVAHGAATVMTNGVSGGAGGGAAAAAAAAPAFVDVFAANANATASASAGYSRVLLFGQHNGSSSSHLQQQPAAWGWGWGWGGVGVGDSADGDCAARLLNIWDWGALAALLRSPRGVAQIITSTAAVASMLPFAYMEVCTMMVQGLAWVSIFNLADVVSYSLAAGLWAAHLRCGSLPASAAFSGALALQHVLLWTKLHYYARVLTPTRGGFNDTIRMVLKELRTFLTFVGLVMLGFAFAFYCLFRQDRDDFADFSTLWHSFASMFAYMLQMFDYSVLYNSTHPFMAMLLFMAYELMVAVLLLNIMIALMTSAFSRVTADEGLRYLIYKAEVIDELESTLPKWLMMRPAWYPHFVHVLKVSPRSTYEINLNSVWSGMSSLQSSLMNAQQETRLRVEALESKMDVIDQKLSATVRLLASRLVSHRELAAALSMDDDVAEASGSGSGELQRELDPDLVGEDGEPDPEHWRDADLDPAKEEQEVPEAEEGDELPLGVRFGDLVPVGLVTGSGDRRGGGRRRGGGGGGVLEEPSPRRQLPQQQQQQQQLHSTSGRRRDGGGSSHHGGSSVGHRAHPQPPSHHQASISHAPSASHHRSSHAPSHRHSQPASMAHGYSQQQQQQQPHTPLPHAATAAAAATATTGRPVLHHQPSTATTTAAHNHHTHYSHSQTHHHDRHYQHTQSYSPGHRYSHGYSHGHGYNHHPSARASGHVSTPGYVSASGAPSGHVSGHVSHAPSLGAHGHMPGSSSSRHYHHSQSQGQGYSHSRGRARAVAMAAIGLAAAVRRQCVGQCLG